MIKYSENVKFEDLERALQRKLMLLDRILNIEIIATSGKRTAEHNAEVGDSRTSSHLKALALDLLATDSRTRFDIIEAGIIAGFSRFGLSIKKQDHVHIDCDPEKPQRVIWFEE